MAKVAETATRARVNRSIVTIFYIAFRPSFYVPPENFMTLTPLTFDL